MSASACTGSLQSNRTERHRFLMRNARDLTSDRCGRLACVIVMSVYVTVDVTTTDQYYTISKSMVTTQQSVRLM